MAKSVATQPEFRAEAKFQRTSPQKAKLVCDLIKGLRVEAARTTVAFSTKKMAPVILKVLDSAIANARYLSDEQGLDIDVDNLYVKSAIANEGPRMKRIRPAPMGRAYRYQRRLAHIIVTVAEKKAPEVGGAKAATADSASAGSKAKKSAAKKPVAKKAAKKSTPKAASPATA
jgi:large subunit ribosomal protein L22